MTGSWCSHNLCIYSYASVFCIVSTFLSCFLCFCAYRYASHVPCFVVANFFTLFFNTTIIISITNICCPSYYSRCLTWSFFFHVRADLFVVIICWKILSLLKLDWMAVKSVHLHECQKFKTLSRSVPYRCNLMWFAIWFSYSILVRVTVYYHHREYSGLFN